MLTRSAPDPVLVVGAGPVGVVTACELLRQGVPVRIIDADRVHSAHSRATGIWPRILELLNRVGAAGELIDRGHRVAGLGYYSGGERLTGVDFGQLRDTPFPFGLSIPQRTTEEVLEKRLRELGGRIERGVRLVGLRQDADGVDVSLVSADGGGEELRASWLVGADGAHSTTRRLLDLAPDKPVLTVGFAITDARIEGDLREDELAYCWTPTGAMALAPLGDGVHRIAVRVPEAVVGTEPSREFFQEMVDRRAPGRGHVLGDLRFSAAFLVEAQTALGFRRGRCFLAGDAAHVMSPAGGQGLNSGVQDAVNLGWKLAGVLTGGLDEAVLDSYDAERRAHVRAVSAATAAQLRLGALTDPAEIAQRDRELRAAGASGDLQRRTAPAVTQLDTGYPVASAQEPAGTARPGDRLPVLPGAGAPAGWTGLPADGFTVLLWPGTSGAEPEGFAAIRAARLPAAVVDAADDPDGVLAGALGSEPCAALVRPDGHLAAVLRPPTVEELAPACDAARRGALGFTTPA